MMKDALHAAFVIGLMLFLFFFFLNQMIAIS